jgi:hypothetical protein
MTSLLLPLLCIVLFFVSIFCFMKHIFHIKNRKFISPKKAKKARI